MRIIMINMWTYMGLSSRGEICHYHNRNRRNQLFFFLNRRNQLLEGCNNYIWTSFSFQVGPISPFHVRPFNDAILLYYYYQKKKN